MKNELIRQLHGSFEDHAHSQDGVDYWYARELQGLLGYARWENFEQAVGRAKAACETAGYPLEDHFREVTKMVDLGSHEHVKNNQDVRKILTDRNIRPEALPPAEDVKKVERRLKSEEKQLPKLGTPKHGKKKP